MPLRGYAKRVHNEKKAMELFKFTERRLYDKAWTIRKNECMTQWNLEAIKRTIADAVGNARNISGIVKEWDKYNTANYKPITISDHSNNEDELIIDRTLDLLNIEMA